MHQEQVTAWPQPVDANRAQAKQIRVGEVITNLRYQDQVEIRLRKFRRELTAREPEVGEAGATGAGLVEGGIIDVDRQKLRAARRELLGEHADRAARLKSGVVAGARQRRERGLVLGRLVWAGGEIPGIQFRAIDVFEVGGRQGSVVHRRQL
jgi:hypothetical protein